MFLVILLFPISTFAVSTPIEKVFKDIDKDYKYYYELQTLYDKWMFFPDKNGNFNPNKLLKRDEFIWVVSEVSCKNCIQPNVSYDLFSKYNGAQSFFDIWKENKYFYCIASATDLKQVKWYHVWSLCEDGSSQAWKAPFCPNNTIILEEALAIMLRVSNILSNNEADFIRSQIKLWTSFPDLSSDVKAKFSNGWVYSFYPDFREALNYEITDVDVNWKTKTYKLLEKKSNKLYPKKAISKEEFLRMAFILLKGNSCIEDRFYNVWVKMKVFNKTCNEKISARCSISKLRWKEKVFDFLAVVWLSTWDKISRKEAYVWRFYDFKTGKEIVKYGRYLDNYDFLQDWKYRVFLRVNTDLWYSWEVYNDINIYNWSISDKESNLKVSIDANPIVWKKWLNVGFRWIVSSSSTITSYFWEYWDSETSYWLNNNHIYKEPWVYEVKLTVTDSDWNRSTATVLINIYDTEKDTDWDGVLDVDDKCIFTKWPKENNGCPVVVKCMKDSDCRAWYICENWVCELEKCVEDSDCEDGYLCKDWVCEIGECKEDIDCKYGEVCVDWNCIWEDCKEDSDCEDWEVCKDWTCETWWCKKDSDCPEGYICKNWDCEEKDTDWDWWVDSEDLCPLVKWPEENRWCPILEETCDKNEDCPEWYLCFNWYCKPKDITRSCEYNWWNLFYGNVVCDTCPCQNNIDFNAILRRCDVIFPAITSPDETEIYSKWSYYKIKKTKD